MKRLATFLATPFGVAVLGCVLLAGWALWSGGILDGPLAKDVRSSSVHAAAGVDLDERAAERIIGNRRLVVAFLGPDADLAEGCEDVHRAADGNVVLLLRPDGDEFAHYGCALLPGEEDDNFGSKFVAESVIARGVDQFVDEPLTALKVVAVNYDMLVKAGTVPDGARTVSPSLPRYLVAGAAIGAVLAGSVLAYLGARRAGRLAADHRDRRDQADDARGALSARAAVLARHIIDLDRRYSGAAKGETFARTYRTLAADYADLVADFAAADADGTVDPRLDERIASLTDRCLDLART